MKARDTTAPETSNPLVDKGIEKEPLTGEFEMVIFLPMLSFNSKLAGSQAPASAREGWKEKFQRYKSHPRASIFVGVAVVALVLIAIIIGVSGEASR
jgi:hypothetical protein